jgi:hypothetical protein
MTKAAAQHGHGKPLKQNHQRKKRFQIPVKRQLSPGDSGIAVFKYSVIKNINFPIKHMGYDTLLPS